jgi:hypothetical protein
VILLKGKVWYLHRSKILNSKKSFVGLCVSFGITWMYFLKFQPKNTKETGRFELRDDSGVRNTRTIRPKAYVVLLAKGNCMGLLEIHRILCEYQGLFASIFVYAKFV